MVCSIDNLIRAELHARRGKALSYGVKQYDKDPTGNLRRLHLELIYGVYHTSPYKTFQIHKPKERTIYRLPYYPDRIVHHAVINILGETWGRTFTADQYSSIKGRGIHLCAERLKKALKEDTEGTRYCLKTDIVKYYPNIDHECLKAIVRKKIKDKRMLALLDEIIDSTDGVPIGNYLSQYFANLYLAYTLHDIKECGRFKSVRIYDYADDVIALAPSKEVLHELRKYLQESYAKQKLTMKANYQVFPVDARGIDFLGYRFFHSYTLLRKTIKRRMIKAARRKPQNKQTIDSYRGWAMHCNSRNLLKTIGI